jgi:uncharacterized protein YndB with AHSA1/START domain
LSYEAIVQVKSRTEERKMATSRVSPDADAVIAEIEIAAPPERVFQALVTREQALQWGRGEMFEITEWEMDARVGGQWSYTARERTPGGGYNPERYEHRGEILEFDPPRLLVYTWFASYHEDPSHKTLVRWELTRASGGTHVRVTHSGLATLPKSRQGYAEGWPGLLQQVKNFVEK